MTGYVRPPAGGAALRLFCFHPAGGGSSFYSSWRASLGPEVEICPVLLPGRERRADELRFTDLEPLLADLTAALSPHIRGPFALFGHSMGGLIAYWAALRFCMTGNPPRAVFVSSCRPPHLQRSFLTEGDLDGPRLVRWLAKLGGVPRPVLRDDDWLRAVLPVLRDDITVCRSQTTQRPDPIACPLHVLGGTDDPLADPPMLRQWQPYTTDAFHVHQFAGGHFYLKENMDHFFTRLNSMVAPLLKTSQFMTPPLAACNSEVWSGHSR